MKFYIHMNRTKSENAINSTMASGSIGGRKVILTPITQSTLEGAFQSGCCFICAHFNPLTKEKSEGT